MDPAELLSPTSLANDIRFGVAEALLAVSGIASSCSEPTLRLWVPTLLAVILCANIELTYYYYYVYYCYYHYYRKI